MKIIGIEGLTWEQLKLEVQKGARFVIYQYCISLIFVSFKRFSNIYFIRSGEDAVAKGLKFSLLSLLLGWWGLPWGPAFTISSFITNFKGGKDVTNEVIASLF